MTKGTCRSIKHILYRTSLTLDFWFAWFSVTDGSVWSVTDATSASIVSMDMEGPTQESPVRAPLAGERVCGLETGESPGWGAMVVSSESYII